MRSVKGMTFGSPEYVAMVKAAEREGEVTELIGEIGSRVDRILRMGIDLTAEQVRNLRRIRRDIGEVTGE